MPPSGGTPGGSSAGLFLPPNQAGAANDFLSILGPMASQSIGNLGAMGQPPAQTAYPFVQNATFSTINNPFQGQAIDSAQNANWFLNNYMIPNATTGAAELEGLGGLAGSNAGAALGAGFNPAYGQAGQMGQGFASQLAGMGSTIANQAFDPQSQLFNRTQNQLLDQSNAVNSMYGLGSSPYGASTTANAVGNFDLNWQNNLLSRMTQGGQAASGLDSAALESILHPANNQVAAAAQGAGAFGNLMGSAERGFAGAAGLLNPVGSAISSFGTQPYNTANTIQGNNMGALQNLISLGNQQYTVPENTLQGLGSYMRLGQSASGLANTIGSTNFNEGSQMFQGAGQLLGGANSMFGGSGGMFGGGGLGSMFAAPGFDAATTASIADVAAGGMGAADVGGGGSLLAEMAPLAFSA
jgi:hypothetical protein